MSLRLDYPIDQGTEAPCQLKTPVYMLGLGVALLRQYFGTEDRLALEKSKYLWAEDQEVSQVYISHQDNLDYQTIGKRPAIIVSLEGMDFTQRVISDRFAVTDEGDAQFMDYSKTGWTFTCISDKALDSLGLAGEIKYFIQTYRQFLRSTYALQTIRVMSLGKYSKQKDFKDLYGTTVSVMVETNDSFEVDLEALKVSAIKLQLSTQ